MASEVSSCGGESCFDLWTWVGRLFATWRSLGSRPPCRLLCVAVRVETEPQVAAIPTQVTFVFSWRVQAASLALPWGCVPVRGAISLLASTNARKKSPELAWLEWWDGACEPASTNARKQVAFSLLLFLCPGPSAGIVKCRSRGPAAGLLLCGEVTRGSSGRAAGGLLGGCHFGGWPCRPLTTAFGVHVASEVQCGWPWCRRGKPERGEEERRGKMGRISGAFTGRLETDLSLSLHFFLSLRALLFRSTSDQARVPA